MFPIANTDCAKSVEFALDEVNQISIFLKKVIRTVDTKINLHTCLNRYLE